MNPIFCIILLFLQNVQFSAAFIPYYLDVLFSLIMHFPAAAEGLPGQKNSPAIRRGSIMQTNLYRKEAIDMGKR